MNEATGVHAMTDAILEQYKAEAFKAGRLAGGAEAVSWLEEVYGDGIHGTDAYAEFIGKSDDCECEWCTEEEEER